MNFFRKLLCWKKKRNVAVTTSDIATQTSAVWEDDAEKDKKIAELQATLKSKDFIYTGQEELLQGMMERERKIQDIISNITIYASTSGNSAVMEKEKTKRDVGTLKMILFSKDRLIRWQKKVINEVIEHRRRNEEAVEEMEVKIATLERLLEKEDRNNGTQDGETTERKGNENIFTKRTFGPGKCAQLRRIRRMEKIEYMGNCFGLETIYEEEEPTQSDT